jgi:hypothetical protein
VYRHTVLGSGSGLGLLEGLLADLTGLVGLLRQLWFGRRLDSFRAHVVTLCTCERVGTSASCFEHEASMQIGVFLLDMLTWIRTSYPLRFKAGARSYLLSLLDYEWPSSFTRVCSSARHQAIVCALVSLRAYMYPTQQDGH